MVAEAAKLEAILAAGRRSQEFQESRRSVDESAFATSVSALDEYFTNPRSAEKAKDNFINMLKGLVKDSDTKNWLFGFAADLVLVHGVLSGDGAARIRDEMSIFVANLRSARERERREGKHPRPHGRWFNKEIHAIAERNGIATPRQRKKSVVC
jgi:hypothetical protein